MTVAITNATTTNKINTPGRGEGFRDAKETSSKMTVANTTHSSATNKVVTGV